MSGSNSLNIELRTKKLREEATGSLLGLELKGGTLARIAAARS